ncbi:O-antigen ligase family protein [Brasilonema sp. UFV-L1]|uniref:O-antigen ligase family protein n=1 Tax=Brasilonema sp. UFV-L1 TaxID=2234130 RepID=UPI00145D416D|nr:O-antigen ligase family protein [Brasilonema sp. UFV-L1]
MNNQLMNRWVRNLEVGVSVIWLLYFMGVKLPSPFTTLLNALSYPIIAILVILRWKRLPYVATRDIPLLLFIGTALASILWSGDHTMTLKGVGGLLRMLMFGAYFATRYSLKDQMKIFAWVFGIAAILSLAVALAIPSYGIDKEGWTGIFTYKNFLGYTMSLAAILFLLTAFKQRRQNWLVWIGFGLAVSLIILAHSSGSLVNILLLLSLMPLYQLVKQHYKLRVIFLGIVCVLVGVTAIFILGNLETILVDILGKNLEFNGRTPIWTLAIEKGMEKPWLGYGYNAFWNSDAGIYIMINTWSGLRETGFNSHNSYLELFLNLGFIGLFLYAISLVIVFIKALILLRYTQKIEFVWYLQLLIFISVASMADTNFIMSGASSYCCIYISTSLSTAIEFETIKRKRNFKKVYVHSG